MQASQRRRDGCTECRRKKVKCDLLKPTCTRCQRYPKGCVYNLSVVDQISRSRPSRQQRHASPSEVAIVMQNRSIVIKSLEAIANQPLLNLSPVLSTEESRLFLHVFATETAPRLFPAAPDWFLQRMISASLETPHLLYSLLAAACSHHGRLVQDAGSSSQLACLKFTNLAMSNLRSTINGSARRLPPETVATALALCTNDVCNGNMHIWRTHLSGVRQLLNAFLAQDKPCWFQDPYIQSLIKWFTTLDLIASLSGQSHTEFIFEAVNEPLKEFFSQSPAYIDDVCGYSLELVPCLRHLSHLIHQQGMTACVVESCSTDEVSQDAMILHQSHPLENELVRLLDSAVSDMTRKSKAELASELQHTHRAFVYSALLHLHRRVHKLSLGHPKVRAAVAGIIHAVQRIRPFSAANILILWPIFSAGCETALPSERGIIQARMVNMQSLGMGNFTRARELLNVFWASGTSLPWDAFFAQLGLELVLF
ncbi:transcription factor domain-containing protein [Aspergillus saccharolyticus JOP 1030-1]|uniref:Zn(2)-C6 fungal-type domain-containing protein n=1 Tax=Aspergillus saccharolyticus JOP 1030-1 TaxID=1450539 RepID=A0A318ZDH8_9EURO|nr:hypothetical protein BP01DRAFT_164269 [Aspergillus saccharolyticus JOP 1030-1]PYH41580.1 hypothetical protein BP01DRAFT_164269 [Aspergillus saccharolyticus JOP 1030-1]